jgi:formylglycine-generating enzyme required for sulfatase activity
VPGQKSRWGSVVTIVSLVIAVFSVLAAVIVVPEVREWLGLDKPLAQHKTSTPVSPPQEITTSIGMELVPIPAGEFEMGLDNGTHESPAHWVRISEPFYMGKYEVTQGQWESVMGMNPSRFKGNPNRPVESVSWEDIQEFIKRLNRQEGWEVCRLPTEVQWEYVARAGTTTKRYEDVLDTTTERFEDVLDAIAWHDANSGGETHEVGQKRPNAWGLYDMLGNVWEWVQDWYAEDYYEHSPTIDPQGPDAGVYRVSRGGGWSSYARVVRGAERNRYQPGYRDETLGFRCSSSGSSK